MNEECEEAKRLVNKYGSDVALNIISEIILEYNDCVLLYCYDSDDEQWIKRMKYLERVKKEIVYSKYELT